MLETALIHSLSLPFLDFNLVPTAKAKQPVESWICCLQQRGHHLPRQVGECAREPFATWFPDRFTGWPITWIFQLAVFDIEDLWVAT